MALKKTMPRKMSRKTAKTRQAAGRRAAVAKARSVPSQAVKTYVKRAVDRAVPDQTFMFRNTFDLSANGAAKFGFILAFRPNTVTNPAWDAQGTANSGGGLYMADMDLPYLLSTRMHGPSPSVSLSEQFPRLKCKLKNIRISGQVSIPVLTNLNATTGTGWAKVHILAFEDRSFDQHQDGVAYNDRVVPATNILMDRRRVSTNENWIDTDCSFTPAGGYAQESASFNSAGFKLLGATNILLNNSTDKPHHNLKKFSFNVKSPQYLTWRQKDSAVLASGSLASNPHIVSNFVPLLAAYAVYENGSISPVTVQLDTSIRIEPPVN